ncbi:TRAP dicarboxylate transporter, DctQ subunit, unknown substrate 6 [hydrothermal vent metagenome]|uniref:Tripartite ATP-independent periplasmic transporters DctQ component domain-containing protein n=1 Tax=hydrothermal vent metagenome TaxID=652676 RepID=A0A3B1AXA8_9ZZZZ
MISWLTLFLVLMQFAIVIGHYIFREGAIFLQESLLYAHSMVFLGAAAYTLRHNGHVRVDVFYNHFREKTKAWINLIGFAVFLFPITAVITWMAWPYVMSSWKIFEGSIESSGIQAVYLLKSMILFFSITLFLQGFSLFLHSILTILNIEHLAEDSPELL